MAVTIQFLKKRFEELEEQLSDVEGTKRHKRMEYFEGDFVDDHLLAGWCVKARNLLSQACGPDSEHYRVFLSAQETRMMSTNFDTLQRVKAVFLAAKEDYEGGYLRSVRSLVHAELFANELEQAAELLQSGYKVAAAVVAGVVLETTLRSLCTDKNIPVSKLDKMNADLAKAGVYNVLMQKRVTMLADIRNKAAHGDTEGFTGDDVRGMIADVERFVADHT
jgi:hypothetical protein